MDAAVTVLPATLDRFDDIATMLAPKRMGTIACWCLSHRLDPATNQRLASEERREYVRDLAGRPIAPGVLAYRDDTVVG
jgi:hypothetical protein